MKKKIAAAVITAALCLTMLLALAGCGGGNSITISNDTNWVMYYCHINASTESQWGEDLLGSDIIAVGDSYTFNLDDAEDNVYDIGLTDEDGDSWIFYGVTIDGSVTASLTAGPYLTLDDGTEISGQIQYADAD